MNVCFPLQGVRFHRPVASFNCQIALALHADLDFQRASTGTKHAPTVRHAHAHIGFDAVSFLSNIHANLAVGNVHAVCFHANTDFFGVAGEHSDVPVIGSDPHLTASGSRIGLLPLASVGRGGCHNQQ